MYTHSCARFRDKLYRIRVNRVFFIATYPEIKVREQESALSLSKLMITIIKYGNKILNKDGIRITYIETQD